MSRLLSPESRVMRFLYAFADLAAVNLMLLLASVPVVTAGAAMAAGFSATRRIAEDSLAHPFRTFWGAFRENFRQATALWIPCLLVLVGLVWDVWLFQSLLDERAYRRGLVMLAALIVLTITVWVYLLMLITGFQNRTSAHVKNAVALSFRYLPLSVLLAGLNGFPFLLALVSPYLFLQTGAIWIGFGFALILLLDNLMLKKLRLLLSAPESGGGQPQKS